MPVWVVPSSNLVDESPSSLQGLLVSYLAMAMRKVSSGIPQVKSLDGSIEQAGVGQRAGGLWAALHCIFFTQICRHSYCHSVLANTRQSDSLQGKWLTRFLQCQPDHMTQATSMPRKFSSPLSSADEKGRQQGSTQKKGRHLEQWGLAFTSRK